MISLFYLPRKEFKLACNNICSLRNKITFIGIHLLAISETHLDDIFNDEVLVIQGYNTFRRDRNSYEGGVAVYVQEQIPTRERYDLRAVDVELLGHWNYVPFHWLHIMQYLCPIYYFCNI